MSSRSLAYLHDLAVLNEGRDCSCDLGEDECEAMQWAIRQQDNRRPTDGQLEIGQDPPAASQLGVDHEDWGGF